MTTVKIVHALTQETSAQVEAATGPEAARELLALIRALSPRAPSAPESGQEAEQEAGQEAKQEAGQEAKQEAKQESVATNPTPGAAQSTPTAQDATPTAQEPDATHSATKTDTPPAPTASLADIRKLGGSLLKSQDGEAKLVAILGEFNAPSLSTLQAEDYDAVVAKINAALGA
jgi:hypothetical protein